MLTSDDVWILLTLVSNEIRREGIKREYDRRHDDRMFYRLVDVRNKLIAVSHFGHAGISYRAVSSELAPRLGELSLNARWN